MRPTGRTGDAGPPQLAAVKARIGGDLLSRHALRLVGLLEEAGSHDIHRSF
jgi:hypothetical protein